MDVLHGLSFIAFQLRGTCAPTLAPKGPAAPFPRSEEGDSHYALPLRPSIVPYGIRPDEVQEWHDMQSKLWSRDREASYGANEDAIRSILRPEVADAL